MDWTLELVVVPVSDVDRAKTFYLDKLGFKLDVDHRAGDDFRVVQRAELVERGTVVEFFHFGSAGQTPGPDPERRDYGTFFSFDDPDGNGWLVQEVKRTEPKA